MIRFLIFDISCSQVGLYLREIIHVAKEIHFTLFHIRFITVIWVWSCKSIEAGLRQQK